MPLLAQGHEKSTLAIITIFPVILFYGLAYPLLLTLIPLILLIFIGHLYFYRDPDRKVETDPQLVISPADGKIFEIDELKGIIRIRMSLLDVHVNRAPVSGNIEGIKKQKGKHWPFFSFLYRGTIENARQTIHINNPNGDFLVVQIVGIFARRCTSYVTIGDEIKQGERLGMLHYGSEVDIHYPPEQFEILVKKNMKTIAGKTPLAKLRVNITYC
ncbi:MAG: phosphatidylserine decarboxylase [Candidatus Hermodarchaeota archaeon]